MKFLTKMKMTNRAYQLECAEKRNRLQQRVEKVYLRKLPVIRRSEVSQDMWLFFESIEIEEEFELVEVTRGRGYTHEWQWYPKRWRPVVKDGSGSVGWHPYDAPRNWRISKMSTEDYLEKYHHIRYANEELMVIGG